MAVSTTRSPAGREPDDERERFARAVDGDVGTDLDPASERDMQLVAALRHAATAGTPHPEELARMRARVLAGFSSQVGDHADVRTLPVPEQRRAPRSDTPQTAGTAAALRGRFMVAAAATLCLLMSLSGMSMLLARDALPGDPLYGFKRTAESAELGLTIGDESRGLKHLQFATARVDEIELLADRADPNDAGDADGTPYVSALDDFEQDVIAGVRLISGVVSSGQPDLPDAVADWARQQHDRLSTVQSALPLAASVRSDSTLELLERVTDRADALQQRSFCRGVTGPATDELGRVPARGLCQPVLTEHETGRAGAGALPATADDRATSSPTRTPSSRPPSSAPAPLPGTEELLPEELPVGDEPDAPPIVVRLPLPLPHIQLPGLLPGSPDLEVSGELPPGP